MSNLHRTHGQAPRGDRLAHPRAILLALIGAAGLLTTGLVIGQVQTASMPAAASGAAASTITPLALPTPPATNPQPSIHPNWSELTVVQQRILAPLSPEWNGLPELARRKWLQIAQAYPRFTPAQQQRLQARMADWIKLTPEQRHRARENFQTTKSVPVQKKSEAWQRYQHLSDDQKKELAAAAKAQKRLSAVTALPSSARLAKDAAKAVHHGAHTKPGTTKSAPNATTPAPLPVTASAPTASSTPAPAPAVAAPAAASTPSVAPAGHSDGDSGNPPPSTMLGS